MNTLFHKLSQVDIKLLRYIHANRVESLDPFFYYLSFLTTAVTIGIFVFLIVIYFKKRSKQILNSIFVLLSIVLTSSFATLFLKILFSRERPFLTYEDITKLSQAGSMSFPSGHTAEAFAVAFGISFLFPQKKFVIPVFIWAILVAYSRMALGVHFPFDILAGILLSLIISGAIFLPYKKKYKKR
ncbi:MAG: phosphatase PAP2 family protein [Bacteroidales bacterium]|nr:phosphatase PAP2 family protein [Bacteroidales bacterium]